MKMIERRANNIPMKGDDRGFLAAVVADADADTDVCVEDESNDENDPPIIGGCLPLQQPSSSTSTAPTLPTPLSRSPAAWLEDTFDTDPTDQLLGSFTCAYAAHILIQGKIFIVRGHRGARVMFFSNIVRRGYSFLAVALAVCIDFLGDPHFMKTHP